METDKAESSSPGVEQEKVRHGALLALFSVFVLVEGVIRFIGNDPDQDFENLDGEISLGTTTVDVFPPIVLILGGVGEVLFGAMGLFVGVSQFAFQFQAPPLTIAALGTMLVFGWFVFIVYTMAVPFYNDKEGQALPAYPAGGFNDEEKDTALVFGNVFASISYCGIMQGMQFYCCLYLYNLQTGNEEKTNDKNKFRVMWYGFLAFLGGFGNLVLGCLVANQEDETELDEGNHYVYPPNLIHYPALTVLSGLLTMIFSFLVLSTLMNPDMVKAVNLFAPFLWLYLAVFHVMTQLVGFGSGVSAPAAQILCLSTSLVLAPTFFANLQKNPPASTSSS